MIVGLLYVKIRLSGIGSLKGKRKIVKSLIERLRSRFNFSVSEIDAQDNKQMAVIGLAVTSNEAYFINIQLDRVSEFIHADGRFYVISISREIFYSNFE